MSSTAIGSTPAKGSSSRMKRGPRRERARDLAAPPLAARQRHGRRVGEVRDRQVLEQRVEPVRDRVGVVLLQLEDRAHVLGDGELAEDRRFLRQVRQAEARALVDREPRQVSPSSAIVPPSPGTRPTIM
jgi:hypothetical protein